MYCGKVRLMSLNFIEPHRLHSIDIARHPYRVAYFRRGAPCCPNAWLPISQNLSVDQWENNAMRNVHLTLHKENQFLAKACFPDEYPEVSTIRRTTAGISPSKARSRAKIDADNAAIARVRRSYLGKDIAPKITDRLSPQWAPNSAPATDAPASPMRRTARSPAPFLLAPFGTTDNDWVPLPKAREVNMIAGVEIPMDRTLPAETYSTMKTMVQTRRYPLQETRGGKKAIKSTPDEFTVLGDFQESAQREFQLKREEGRTGSMVRAKQPAPWTASAKVCEHARGEEPSAMAEAGAFVRPTGRFGYHFTTARPDDDSRPGSVNPITGLRY